MKSFVDTASSCHRRALRFLCAFILLWTAVKCVSQNMVAIEVWDEFRFCRFSHLHEALGDADLIRVTNNFLIFKCCQWTINLRMPACFIDRHVLVHDRNENIIAESIMNPIQTAAAVSP